MKMVFYILAFNILFFNSLYSQTTFTLPPLPYSYDAFEPIIDSTTMKIHHTKHHQAYINNLNKAVMADSSLHSIPLEDMMRMAYKLSPTIRNNGGGHWNHTFFWETISPKVSKLNDGILKKTIEKEYGSLDSLKKELINKGLGLFGSGWVWLIKSAEGPLKVCATPNQDNPLMNSSINCFGLPLIGIDVWEHAYYLNYQSNRSKYLSNILEKLDWETIENRFLEKK